MAIVHRQPKYIQVFGAELFAQLVGQVETESELLDALMRSLRQEDDVLYASFGAQRWRHFFESDFMVSYWLMCWLSGLQKGFFLVW